MDGHQVHTYGSPEWFSVHVHAAVASFCHLESILGLCIDSVCGLWTEFVKDAVSVFFPVKILHNVELVLVLVVLLVGVEKVSLVLLKSREGHLSLFHFLNQIRFAY